MLALDRTAASVVEHPLKRTVVLRLIERLPAKLFCKHIEVIRNRSFDLFSRPAIRHGWNSDYELTRSLPLPGFPRHRSSRLNKRDRPARVSWCCHTRRTFQPLPGSVLVTKQSRAFFRCNFL